MPKTLKWIIIAVAVLVAVLAGLAVALWLASDPEKGALDTELKDVTVTTSTTRVPPPPPEPEPLADRVCWREFGGEPRRSLARPRANLGLPKRKLLWVRMLGGYVEFPAVYCDGTLYVNTVEGTTFAIETERGKVRWKRRVGGTLPSSPAIDGPRLFVASQSGAVTALDRARGRVLWRVQTAGKVESSPVVVGNLVYFGSHDGRLFAVDARTGSIRWAYRTPGRINASPSIVGRKVCVTTYAGSFVCVDRRTGRERWTTYVKRDAFRYESFYASASSDGRRLYSLSRSGTVVAVDARDGSISWTARVGGYGYTTPAVSQGRVFAGGLDGRLRAFSSSSGERAVEPLARRQAPGRAGRDRPVRLRVHPLEPHVRLARVGRGHRLATSARPLLAGIATERTYFFTLSGRLLAYEGRDAPPPRLEANGKTKTQEGRSVSAPAGDAAARAASAGPPRRSPFQAPSFVRYAARAARARELGRGRLA